MVSLLFEWVHKAWVTYVFIIANLSDGLGLLITWKLTIDVYLKVLLMKNLWIKLMEKL